MPGVGATGTSVGASAEMIRCSRPTSCADARTELSGGRRSAQRRPASSVTLNVRFERPPAISSKVSGGVMPSTLSTNHRVTFSASIPFGADTAATVPPVGAIQTAGHCPRRGARPTMDVMEQLHQIVDGDPGSLEQRIVRALERGPLECVVARFPYWYTGRPPVYEAVVFRRLS